MCSYSLLMNIYTNMCGTCWAVCDVRPAKNCFNVIMNCGWIRRAKKAVSAASFRASDVDKFSVASMHDHSKWIIAVIYTRPDLTFCKQRVANTFIQLVHVQTILLQWSHHHTCWLKHYPIGQHAHFLVSAGYTLTLVWELLKKKKRKQDE